MYDVSATLEYYCANARQLYLYCRSLAKSEFSKQVLVSTYRYKTILGCDPQKMRTTIPNEEEIALKHSSLDSQLKTSAALSLSLSLWTSKVNETVKFTLIGSQLSDIE